MKKFIILSALALGCLGFDIDDLDRGVALLNGENPTEQDVRTAYEIFAVGCEMKDAMACEELGLMYINEQVNVQMDGALARRSVQELGVEYLMKSCDLGYLNGCSDVLNLREQLGVQLGAGVYENAKSRYDELLAEYIKQTQTEANVTEPAQESRSVAPANEKKKTKK